MLATSPDARMRQVLRDGGEMGALMRAFDWSSTSLGPVSEWPRSLCTAVAVLLNTRHPMFIWWGPELIQFYNDDYRRSLGPDRHPSALGQRGRDCWAEIWPIIGAEVESVLAGGSATWHEDHLVPITRGDRVYDVYWSYSYSPILDDDAGVGGVLVTVQETTKRVLTERRARMLQDLAGRELQAESESDAVQIAVSVLEEHREDIPCALIYLGAADGEDLHLAGTANFAPGQPLSPATVRGDEVWPAARAISNHVPVLVGGLADNSGSPVDGSDSPPHQALVVPLVGGRAGGRSAVKGVLVAGLNPRLPADEDSGMFFQQVAREITHALERARAVESERREWHEAQRAAAEQEAERQRLAGVFELSPTFLAVLRGPEHVFELTNHAYNHLTGNRELIGKPARRALPEIEGQRFLELLDQVYRTGEPFVGNELPILVHRSLDGTLETRFVNFVYQPMRGPDGMLTGILVSGSDVTELVRARAAAEGLAIELHIERRQLLTVLEQAPLGIILVEAPTGRVLFANDRVLEIFGETQIPDHLGSYGERWLLRHRHGRPLTPAEGPIARVIQNGDVVANETMLIEHAAGQQIEIVINAAPVRDGQGGIIAGVAMFWDVTAERRTERRLRDAERLQSVGTLAGGVAHEVNNQMTTVLGFGEFILRALGPEHPQTRDLRVLLKAAGRTAQITNQLLTFSRRQVTNPRVIKLHALVIGLLPVLQQLLGSDKELVVEGGPSARLVAVDPTQVEQVLINLIANARDATETGSTVTISVQDADLTDANAAQHGVSIVPGAYVLLTVSDTGRGMDTATLARVFEPFFTTKQVGEGTGLGLSMVYGIVKRHGGYVWAESTPGGGTTLKLYWPSTNVAETAGTTVQPGDPYVQPAGTAAGLTTVLVVEDEASVRELVVRTLRAEGYEVLEAGDGLTALESLHGPQVPDLVLTDVIMPGMNGRQLGDKLRTMRPQLPILYMSGDIGKNTVTPELIPEGAPFLQKPFTPAELLQFVAAGLPEKQTIVHDTVGAW